MKNPDTTTKRVRRPRRSIKLSSDEKRNLKAWIKTFPTKYDASLALDVSERTFYRVANVGSCKQEIYDKLKAIAKI